MTCFDLRTRRSQSGQSTATLSSHNRLRTAVAVAMTSFALQAGAFETPTNLSVDDETLTWESDAPSINIYEDGEYRATVHGSSVFSPVFEGSVYQVVAHDHGMEFSSLSDPLLVEDDDSDEEDDDEDEEREYDEARLYFELNDTDGDLGLHALVDAEDWKTLRIEDITGRIMFDLEVKRGLLDQGMTEIFFESSEPDFDDLDPAEFFARFPAGEYEVNGKTLDGEELESDLVLSHVIPAAPAGIIVNGQSVPPDCDQDTGPGVSGPVLVSWGPVMSAHATLGVSGNVVVDKYQVVIEREDPTALLISIDVASDVTQLALPAGLLSSGDELKIEILTIADSGNQSATESCFTID